MPRMCACVSMCDCVFVCLCVHVCACVSLSVCPCARVGTWQVRLMGTVFVSFGFYHRPFNSTRDHHKLTIQPLSHKFASFPVKYKIDIFCTNSNENKLEVVASAINFNANLHFS